MSVAKACISDSVALLTAALEMPSASNWEVGIQQVLEVLIDLIADGNAEEVNAAYEAIDRLEAAQDGTNSKDVVARGQLQVLSMLASLAAVRPGRAQLSELAGREAEILWALFEAGVALDNGEIVTRSGHPEAVVSRGLRQLRAAGLVKTRQEWRRKFSELTDKGRRAVEELPRPLDGQHRTATILARLQRFDAGPADVWAMARRIGADVLSAAPKVGGETSTAVTIDISNWRISISGDSEEDTRMLVAEGLGELAAVSKFPPAAAKHTHAQPIGAPEDVPQFHGQDDSRRAVFAKAYSAALLMPELATFQAFFEIGNARDIASTFQVSENVVRKRLRSLGLDRLHLTSANEPEPDWQLLESSDQAFATT